MSCPNCNSFDYQTHSSENHKIHLCNVCEKTFGNFQNKGYCCEHKNVKIVEFELSNKQTRKANICINCLKNFGNVIQSTPQYMFVSYDERQKIREKIQKEYYDLYQSVLNKKHYYKETYYNYLKSDEWKKKRLERLKIDKFTCQICNKQSGRLDVHHTTYQNIYKENINDLITLCENCHKKLHEND